MDTFFPGACKKMILTSSKHGAIVLQLHMRTLYRKCYIILHVYRGLLYHDISIYNVCHGNTTCVYDIQCTYMCNYMSSDWTLILLKRITCISFSFYKSVLLFV